MRKSILLTGLALYAATANAQCFKEGYIDWGYGGTGFAKAISTWQKNKKVSADDNFFISRIKPKKRFRNEATQVRAIAEANDKKLLAWVPINDPLNNAIPDGKFDSEVFNMWSYVTHYGDWTSALGRVPAAFLDVAHKNGVGVSGVAGIPNTTLGGDWEKALNDFVTIDHQVVADFLKYYGNDGLGYNSEFYGGQNMLPKLRNLHAAIVKASTENPVFENFWYDGTSDNGSVMFDRGLSRHNIETFGDGDNKRTSLFFNYNWNEPRTINLSLKTAEKYNRNPLDLYAGINMQGGEPRRGARWTMLKEYPLSIGLWGAHQQNMFWESRNEQGSTDDAKQRTYMLRTERWFTGGTRNPANCPEINDNLTYALPNTDFHGMSSMMSARSALSWNLTEEPFVTFFNLGNGKFFNWKGVRQNDNQWYNIGIQDYLPTWRYWFADKLLGKTATDVPQSGLDAEFVWDDAYVGGSCMRVYGTTANEYLHLFKTKYTMQTGDVITVRYKLMKGAANVNLVLTAEKAENVAISEDKFNVMTTSNEVDEDVWVEKTFTVGDELTGKDLALVALHFQNAENLNLYLGEFSIVRGNMTTPEAPEVVSSEALAIHDGGVDGKIIFNMKNSKQEGTPCYNIDVKTSLFKIYAQQEGGKEVCMGATTSWAALVYNAPVDFSKSSRKVRFGVSAVSLDSKTESPITWGNYNENPEYSFNDDVTVNKTTIKPNEAFEMSYMDSNHEEGTWKLVDASNKVVFEGQGQTVTVNGLDKADSYDLILNGKVSKDGKRVDEERRFNRFVQITSESIGALPEIKTLTANEHESDIQVGKNEAVNLSYTGRSANGKLSRGVNLREKGFGFLGKSAGMKFATDAWTCAFWVKFKSFANGSIQFLDIRDQGSAWPTNNWGLVWSTFDKKEKTLEFVIRGNDKEHHNTWSVDFAPGVWNHVTITMEKDNANGIREHLYINGVEATCIKNNNGAGYNEQFANASNWSDEHMIMIGQGRHQCSAMDAIIDDVKFFNTEVKKDKISELMNNSSLAEQQSVYYSFEKDANATHAFANEASANVEAGIFGDKRDDKGHGYFAFSAPNYDAGSPFIAGEKFEVTTVPTWKAKKAKLSDETGNDQNGSAKVTYAKDGVYEVTLTLSNSYGAATKTFKTITVGNGATGIEDATLNGTEVTVENGVALVNFAAAGNYNVRVYNAAGQLVASMAQFMTEGQQAQVALGQAGVYVLQIEKDGKNIAAVKLLNK